MYNVLNIAKYGEITTKVQFIGTATEPQRNRIFRQFNNDQYSSIVYFILQTYATSNDYYITLYWLGGNPVNAHFDHSMFLGLS